jgi:hypothetical protein
MKVYVTQDDHVKIFKNLKESLSYSERSSIATVSESHKVGILLPLQIRILIHMVTVIHKLNETFVVFLKI